MPFTPNYRRRALMFTLGLLLSVAAVGQLYVGQRQRTITGQVVSPAGWALHFCPPAGWQTRGPTTDLFGAEEYVYMDPTGQCFFSIRRLEVSSDTTPATLANWGLRKLERELEIEMPGDAPSRSTSLGPWPARLIEVTLEDVHRLAEIHASVLAAISADADARREAYTIDLFSGPVASDRHDAVWRAIIDAITFDEKQE